MPARDGPLPHGCPSAGGERRWPPRRLLAARGTAGHATGCRGVDVNPRFEPAGSGRLAKHAYHQVRKEILGQRLGAGTVLNEGSIAESLGMSKTPVRHALHALRQEGLLEPGPRRQLVVRNLSPLQRAELV